MTASNLDRGEARDINKHMDKHLAPAMPTVMPEKQTHREKLRAKELVVNLMVARPVGRNEVFSNPAAQAAMAKEWAALKEQKVWNLMIVREKKDVMEEARATDTEVQFGRVQGIGVEKNL